MYSRMQLYICIAVPGGNVGVPDANARQGRPVIAAVKWGQTPHHSMLYVATYSCI